MNGLILAGGNSHRMGHPKSMINYHNMPQFKYCHQLLKPFCNNIFISCKQENLHLFNSLNTIIDEPQFSNSGPIGGILSAFNKHLDTLFILGVDYPLVDLNLIEMLLLSRDLNQMATVFNNPKTQKPEPLIGIYESACAKDLKSWFDTGNTSLRMFLENHSTHIISCYTPEKLISADTPELSERIKNQLSKI